MHLHSASLQIKLFTKKKKYIARLYLNTARKKKTSHMKQLKKEEDKKLISVLLCHSKWLKTELQPLRGGH